MFNTMVAEIKKDTVKALVRKIFLNDAIINKMTKQQNVMYSSAKNAPASAGKKPAAKAETVRKEKQPGRNDPCPCGSGKKYKNCCGK
ncbi:MAG: SEC-C domain-containing protein [Clostridia bacterium]|nr:SEC-C domain-containing protein [Clostridia bacterium]